MKDKLTNKDKSELIVVIIISVIMMCIGFFLGYFGRIDNEPKKTEQKQEILQKLYVKELSKYYNYSEKYHYYLKTWNEEMSNKYKDSLECSSYCSEVIYKELNLKTK